VRRNWWVSIAKKKLACFGQPPTWKAAASNPGSLRYYHKKEWDYHSFFALSLVWTGDTHIIFLCWERERCFQVQVVQYYYVPDKTNGGWLDCHAPTLCQ
jgi:hypothetical protein